MLGKLLKHEFIATSRVMLPLYCVLLATSVFANISIRLIYNANDYKIVDWFSGLGITIFGIAIAAVSVMALVLMINRFYKNLMADEGYLMFTLPVTTHQILFSKIIVSVVWFVATALADAVAVIIAVFRVEYVKIVVDKVRDLFSLLTPNYVMHGTFYIIELLVMLVLAMSAACLVVYASVAIGHGFSNHKGLISFAAFFAIWTVTRVIGIIGLVTGIDNGWWGLWKFDSLTNVHVAFCSIIAVFALYGVIFYFVTNTALKKHLNLS